MAQFIDEIPGSGSSTEDSQEDEEHRTSDHHQSDCINDPDDHQPRRRKLPFGTSEQKVSFGSDSDSDSGPTFPLRKRLKKTASRPRPKKDPNKDPSHSKRPTRIAGGIVGKKPKRVPAPPGRNRVKDQLGNSLDDDDDDDDDDDSIEANLPEYLKQRRADFKANLERLQGAGLRLPPSYEDIEFSDDERLESLAEKPQFDEEDKRPLNPYEDRDLPQSGGVIPAPVAQWLFPYQYDGVAFLHKKFVYQEGGLLGDDMGLGKTIQVIAFLLAAFGKTGDERDAKRMRKIRRHAGDRWYPRILLISPGGLMSNWQAELEKWSWFHVDLFHGPNKDDALQSARAGRTEIVITTYKTFTLNADALNEIEWDAVIADEVHLIKRWRARTNSAMNNVNSLCRLGLTGTALQNNYDELWTLLNWASPGKLGALKSWKRSISDPLKLGQSHLATQEELAVARTTANKLVNNLLPRFFMRREKKLIANKLPVKHDRVVFCPLTELQAEVYETYVCSELIELIRNSTNMCDCGSRRKQGWCCSQTIEEGTRWQDYVFPAILNCGKIANHLALMIPQPTDTKEQQAKNLDTLQTAMPDRWRELYSEQRSDVLNTYTNREFCGKWRVLEKLLAFWYDASDKVLVFSHSVKLLKMLHLLFTAKSNYIIHYLDGSMSYADRTAEVDNFNSDPNAFVFLISTKAGGTGLNITSANKVVIVDPNWNPAHDLQAQDRAYRLGQRRDVEVFRLVSAGTIEEIVYARQIYKQQQASIAFTAATQRRYFKGVQDRTDKKGEIFGLANMFAFHEQSVLQGIVNTTNIAESRAGVAVTDLDVESIPADDDGVPQRKRQPAGGGGEEDAHDAAMRDLASLISQGEDLDAGSAAAASSSSATKAAAQPSAISAILARAGVTYTHSNSQVLGPSRTEARLSRRAVEGASASRTGAVFGSSTGPSHAALDENATSVPPTAKLPEKKYNPPADVQRRTFASLARWCGEAEREGGLAAFALLVEGWSAAKRRDVLERFYAERGAVNVDGIVEDAQG